MRKFIPLNNMHLLTPVEQIPRIGPAYQKRLRRLGIKTVRDILYHFPHRYDDFSNLIKIADIREGCPASAEASAGKAFCFQGEISEIRNIRTFRRKMMLTQAQISDETGKLKALWFNQPYLVNTFKKGDFVCLAGKINGKGSAKYLSNPAYEKIPQGLKAESIKLNHTAGLIPVYPETEGLSSKWLRFIVKPLLLQLKSQIQDYLPEAIMEKYKFPALNKALWQIHFPDSLKLAEVAKKRFGFEELFDISLFVISEKMKLAKEKAVPIKLNLDAIQRFTKNLPFTLTDSQKKSAWQILKDMEKPRPMNRLLEGDVGSGKTVVAAMAALNVAKAGFQTAFMAPTEILAKQHYKTLSRLLEKFGLNIGLITGKENYLNGEKIKRKELLQKLLNHGIDILIGTHALVQNDSHLKTKKEPLVFSRLALVVIDEQHRFGAEQRAALCRQQEFIPHLLSMTATPIPRTLSLTVYGDLDLSLIDEMPKGRKKIITKVIQPKEKKSAYDFIREEAKQGRQAFVICPRIEPSVAKATEGQPLLSTSNIWSWQEVKAVKEEYKKLSEEIFPDLKVAMLHGKMRPKEKEDVMQDFKDRKTDILVSTSVVEVGVDIPNATIMMIEGSEKFGLAQLHQFRGRVGRSDFQSYCFLFTDAPGMITSRRLKALIDCENGFELAEKDLAIRGPGDFSGIRQWGIPDLAMASLSDADLVSNAREEAKNILAQDPELKKHPLLKSRLSDFEKRVHME